MTPPLPDFAEFFHAAHGHAPTPWQMQLADRVAAQRRWAEGFVVPDGAGKLGCIDIAVWWLALEAERPAAERAAPTRIWWVDEEPATQPSAAFGHDGARDALPPEERALRRDGGRDALPPEERALGRDGGQDALRPEEGALGRVGGQLALPLEEGGLGQDDLSCKGRGPRREGVSPSIRAASRVSSEGGDECAAWASELAQVLADAALEPVSRAAPVGLVAHRLLALGGNADGVPLAVVDASSCDTSLDPAQPAVIVASLAMYGSRLLFRGYGAEQPAFEAAMAGTDSLVLVPDVGAAERLAGLVAALGECFPGALPLLPGSRPAATVVGVAGDARAGAGDDAARMPELLAGLVWEWVKTTTPPEGEAPVEPYLYGIGGGGLGLPVGGHELDRRSERIRPQPAFPLDHLESLGKASAARAWRVAERLGLPSALCETVTLAAQLKDIGMADARFQRSLVDGRSTAQALDADEWPSGGRHEALSARLVGAWLEQRPEWGEPVARDLLVHLVASHRGAARPLAVPVGDGTEGTVCARIAGVQVEVSADLAETDWEQPARFRRLNSRFGPWGLALLEAVVACCDGAAERGRSRGLPA